MKTTLFMPIKLNNERTPGKNIKCFDDGTPLLQVPLHTALKAKADGYVDRIIVMNRGQVMFDQEPKEVFGHYKELEEIGLAAPQVTYIMQELREKGLMVDTGATTIEEAKNSILSALRRQR